MTLSEAGLDTELVDYSLDQPHPHPTFHQRYNTQPRIPCQLNTFNLPHDPILTLAGPFQQNFTIFPAGSPLVTNELLSDLYGNSSVGSSVNFEDYYSPPASGYPSAVSNPQPGHKGEHSLYLEQNSLYLRHQNSMPYYASQRPSNLLQPQYLYHPTNEQIFSAVSSAGPSSSMSPPGSSLHQHVGPSRAVGREHTARRSPGTILCSDKNTYSFGADSNSKEDGDVTAFADRNMMQTEYASIADSSLDINDGLQWDANLSGQFDCSSPYSPPRKEVTIGGTGWSIPLAKGYTEVIWT